jgi:hypothetical protein
MFNSRGRGLRDDSPSNARAGRAVTRVAVLLALAVTGIALSRCGRDKPSGWTGIYEWPAQEDYDIFPIERAVAALASVGMVLDADSVHCDRVALEDANEAWANIVHEVQTEELARLRSRLSECLDSMRWRLQQDSADPDAVPITSSLAFFDPRSKTVYAVKRAFKPEGWNEDEFRYFIALHELVHVWRDQQTPLLSLMKDSTATTEGWNIARFMLEGEAQFAAAYLVNQDGVSATFPADQWTVADISKRDLVYRAYDVPYISGAQRALEIFEAGGWPALLQAFDDPPASSEQAMHPEKREDAPQLPLDPSELDEEGLYRVVAEDRLGELGFLALFQTAYTPTVSDRTAAAGWDGDLVSLVELPSGEEVLFGRSVWDRETDVEQVMKVLRRNRSAALRRSGCVIDWTSGDEALLDSPAFATWARRTGHWQGQPEDAASTAQVEARFIAEAAAVSYDDYESTHLSFPALGVRIDLPRGWLAAGEFGLLSVPPPNGGPGTLGIRMVVGPPLPDVSGEKLSERLQQRISVYDSGEDSTRIFEVRRIDDTEGVISSSRSENGLQHRALALPTRAGILLFHVDALPSAQAHLHDAWETLIQQIRTGVIDERTWNEQQMVFEEPLPDLELPR